MSYLKTLKESYGEEWIIGTKRGTYIAKWNQSMEKLVDVASDAFGDFEKGMDTDIPKLMELAKEEKGTVMLILDMRERLWDIEVKGIKNKEVEEYLVDVAKLWATMTMEDLLKLKVE